jgi:hypothetical protein
MCGRFSMRVTMMDLAELFELAGMAAWYGVTAERITELVWQGIILSVGPPFAPFGTLFLLAPTLGDVLAAGLGHECFHPLAQPAAASALAFRLRLRGRPLDTSGRSAGSAAKASQLHPGA